MSNNEYWGDYRGINSGFYYNGTHSSEFHVEYIPDASDRWFEGTDWEIYQKEISWHNGGYYYGNAAKVKTFTLKCYYEEITTKQREDIRAWLHRDTMGKLKFDDMPFVEWNVRPTKIVPGKKYLDCGLYSGTFTLTLTAYDPFGYLTRKYNQEGDDDNAQDYCDLIDEEDMPPDPTTSSTSFDVYNPGREACGLTIRISGSTSNPIEFLNTTNKTRCILESLPTNNLILDVDADYGVISTYVASNPNNKDFGYAYHDRGFVRLDPGLNHIDIMEKTTGGSWTSPTTLSMNSIEIDYAPRVL